MTMPQSSQHQFYFQQAAPMYGQEGGSPAHSWDKQQQAFSHQWENNGGPPYHMSASNNMGSGPAQNRQVGPQQPPPPSQPPPTSTPPGLPHPDLTKSQVIANQAQINYVQAARPMNPQFAGYPRGSLQQSQQIRHRSQIVAASQHNWPQLQQVLTPIAPIAAPFPQGVMFQQHRQGTPYQNTGQFLVQHTGPGGFYHGGPHTPNHYYPQVIQQAAYQAMGAAGAPTPGSQGSVPIMRPPLVPTNPTPIPPSKHEKKRPNAIKIINPDTLEEVVTATNESTANNNNVTPSRSNDNSARVTPQPATNAGLSVDNSVAADFAARVAQSLATDDETPEPPPSEVAESESEVVVQHKQPSSLSIGSEEFVPRSQSHVQVAPAPAPVVPTVSAESSSPAVDIQSPVRISKRQAVPAPAPVPPVPVSAPLPTLPVENKNRNKPENVPPPKEKREKRSVSKEQSPVPAPAPAPAPAPVPVEVAPVASIEVAVEVLPPPPPANVVKMSQHHNGIPDVPVSNVDSNKSSGKGKNKKGKSKELNRKVVDKEGSDMDAFTTEPIVPEEQAERPVSPAAPLPPTPAPPAAPATAPAPAPVLETTPTPRAQSPINKIQEDLLEKESKQEDLEKEAQLVAAKNLENSLSKPEEEKPAKPAVAKLTLKRSYRADQWSPLNPEGKKKYDREFLMDLKSQPQSNQKPDNLPDVVAVIKDSSNNMRSQNNMGFMGQGHNQGMLPQFVQRNSQSQRGPLPKRGSQQGNKGKNPKMMIHMTLSTPEDIKLKTVENAWKPGRLDSDANKPETIKETEDLYKAVRGILNKLTPQRFDILMKKFKDLKIDSEEKLKGVINLIFEKAVDEPNFAKSYAHMCRICSKIEVSKVENGVEQKVNFRKILINRCQTEFESSKPAELDIAKHKEEIRNCTNAEQKKELQLTYEEKERAMRMKSVGNIRFIGELFKLNMLIPAIMYRCIEHLLSTPEEESLECLCKLLTTIGKELEFGSGANHKIQVLNSYFQKMLELTQKKDGSYKVSSRVRFMLQDVIELRQSKWVPRRDDNNPKTIDQIVQEAEKESLEMSIALNQQPPRINNRPSDHRQDDRGKRNNRGGNNNNVGEDGWVNVGSKHYHNKQFTTPFEASKMMNVKPDLDLNNFSLGSGSQFRQFGQNRAMENKPGPASTFTSSNAFSALSRGDERKPPQPSMNSNRRIITPTPSIERDKERERERQRMIQGVESDGRSSRGSSAQRGPPSRDSSVPPPATKPADAPSVPKTAPVDQEKLERKTNTILEEYLTGLSPLEDVKMEVEQIFTAETSGLFVEKALQLALERKTGTQRNVGLLLSSLIHHGVVTTQVIIEQLGLIYDMIEDIAIDIPKVWELQAQILVPILMAERINYSHLKSAFNQALNTPVAVKLLLPTFTLLAQEKGAGPAFVRKLWDASNVSLKDFLPADVNVEAFIKENSLEYLTGEVPKFEGSATLLPMDVIQDKLLRLLQHNQSYEKIIDFISTNVGNKVGDVQFIRALITSICENCLSGSNFALDSNKLIQHKKLIQRFVDHKEDRELAAINAVHMLVSRLEHPSGLIQSIFNTFLDNNLISSDSFLKWKDDKENVEQKGVSVFALKAFFALLKEEDTDEEMS